MTDTHRPTRGIYVGTLLGGRVIVQPSTLLALTLLALLFSSGAGVELSARTFLIGLGLAALLFASVFLHELAHAVAARAFKRKVNEIVITLWGGHTSFDAEGITPRVSGLTALAGPLANVAIAGALQTALWLEVLDGRLAVLGSWLVLANLILAAFNALPGIPMDGGRVLESVVWAITRNRHRGTLVAAWGGRVVALGVVAFALGAPLLAGERPTLFSVAWSIVIFSLLWPAASAALKTSTLMGRREGISAATLMVAAVAVPHHVSVADARAAAASRNAVEVVVTSPDGSSSGHFPVSLTDAVPQHAHATTGLQPVTMPLPRGTDVTGELAGDALVESLKEWWGRTDVWVVREHGEVVGVVRLAHALKALQ